MVIYFMHNQQDCFFFHLVIICEYLMPFGGVWGSLRSVMYSGQKKVYIFNAKKFTLCFEKNVHPVKFCVASIASQ